MQATEWTRELRVGIDVALNKHYILYSNSKFGTREITRSWCGTDLEAVEAEDVFAASFVCVEGPLPATSTLPQVTRLPENHTHSCYTNYVLKMCLIPFYTR